MARLGLFSAITVVACATGGANAQVLIGGSLNNGNLDRSYAQEIVPGFFLPKPAVWINYGFRSISGPYEDELSSEPWAGPAPTPVTTDGLLDPPPPDGVGGPDGAVFFKPFSGNTANGLATGHVYQDLPATPGLTYSLSGWAGAEANFLGKGVFAVEFLDGGGLEIPASGSELDLIAAGLFTPNGQPFNYKLFTVSATAPAGTVSVRARFSMIDGISNPSGGGQAFVVDDFLLVVPEPGVASLGIVGLAALALARRRRA